MPRYRLPLRLFSLVALARHFPRRPAQPTPLTPATVPHDPHDGHEAKPRPWMAVPHRAQTTARPPTVGSPPPRSARLGSTTSPSRRAPISSTPPPADLQSVPPPLSVPLHPTAPDPDVQAAAAHLSNTLLNYSHRNWEQAQRDDPLCDATRRYIQLGCLQHRLTSLCDHIPSHRRPAPTDILDLAAKGCLIQGDYGTTLFVRNPVTVAFSPVDLPASAGFPSMTLFASMCPFGQTVDHARLPRRCLLSSRCYAHPQNA